MACLLILSLELLAVFLLPPMLGLAPNVSDLESGFWAPPSAEHPLGTDDVGRDLLARLLSGGQVSLLIGLSSAAISVAVGVPLGLLAGYRRGAWEFWIMRLADIFQTFPSIVLVLCLVTLTGASVLNLVLVLGLLGWTGIARLVYGKTPGRVLAYRIVMGLDFLVLMLPFPDILKSFVRSLANGSFLPLCLVYIVVSLVMLVTGCRRTYSGQVFR